MTTEQRLVTVLQELVPEPPRELRLAEIAARVTETSSRQARVRGWLTPLAAAVVVGVVVAIVVLVRGSSNSRPPAAPTPSPKPTSTTLPTTTQSHTPAPTTSPPPTHTPSPGPKLTGTIHVGGATLVVPAGWVARQMPLQAMPTWCLTRTSAPSPAALRDCPIWFRRVLSPDQRFNEYADTAIDAFSTQCKTPETPTHFTFATRTLGGRSADFTQGQLTCPRGNTRFPMAEYFVPTRPGYILYSGRADTDTRAVTAQIARDAKLPTQRGPLRYTILGNVETRSHQQDGYHVVLTPWTRDFGDPHGQFIPIPGGVAQTYVIPDALVPDHGITLVGLIVVTTDGYHVTSLEIVGG